MGVLDVSLKLVFKDYVHSVRIIDMIEKLNFIKTVHSISTEDEIQFKHKTMGFKIHCDVKWKENVNGFKYETIIIVKYIHDNSTPVKETHFNKYMSERYENVDKSNIDFFTIEENDYRIFKSYMLGIGSVA